MGVLVAIAVVVVLVLAAILIYNRMVAKRQAVDNSWAQIETALKRRHDLIPNLVEAVKGYAKHEQSTFENVTKARAAAMAAKAPPSQAGAEDLLTQLIGKVMVVAEAYPELKASENFGKLQDQLGDTEDQIAITRRVYNDTVQTYNTTIQVFPSVLIARAFHFEPRLFFDAAAADEATPEVSFSGGEKNPAADAKPPAGDEKKPAGDEKPPAS